MTRRARPAALALAVWLVVVGSVVSMLAVVAVPVASASPVVAMLLWGHEFAVHPRTFRMSGDSTLFARDVRWRHWGSRVATGRGEAAFNLCRPDCAAGHFQTVPARLTVSDLHYCRISGFRSYERTTLTVLGRHDLHGYARRQVLTVPCTRDGQPTLR